MEDGDFDQRLRELQREYLEFLDDEEDQGIYMQKVKSMIGEESRRLIVNINDLRRKNPERAKNLLETAFEEQIAFQKALKEYVSSIDPTYAKQQEEFFVAFSGSFGTKHVTPRSLTSRYLGNLICVEGIVTRVSLVRPKVVRSVHYCPATKKVMERKYTDLTSFEAFPTSAIYPTKDDDGNPLETEYGLSRYKDHQTLTIQEMPERAPAGQLPRSVDVVCDDDLVDLCKPGDRVQVVGNYRCLPNKQGSFTAGTFRTILIANNVTQINKDMNLNLTVEDIKLCKNLAKRTTLDMFELLSKSLAPSIHGHDYIKKAILCLLLGGMEKILPNGTRLRGDINILLIGDPSVAKSQLLRYVLMTAPRAITTTGRGSSGVGLTAAVTTDPETGDRRLEAGAMVLADRGVVCIDEFDKMSDIDRTAIHEVMEQGRVTIAKAGVHASLNARCAVLAAANPVYGRYDQYKTPMENIGLQDSLLSRFDLLFVMLDIADADHDNLIAEHVLRMHRYRNPKEQDGDVLPMGSSVEMLSTENPDNNEVEDTKETMYEKYDPLLHGKSRSKKDQILSSKFMRKYINVARMMKPKLTQEACDTIADEYARLRNQDMMDSDVARTQPVTARTLETLIRLSSAHAKCRLDFKVTQDDALVAIELVHYAYFKKVLTKEKSRKRRASSGDEANGSDAEPAQPRPKKTRRTEGSATQDPYTFSSDEEIEPILRVAHSSQPEPSQRTTRSSQKPIDPARLAQFKDTLQQMFRSERVSNLPLDRITAQLNDKFCHEPFDGDEIHAALQRMTNDNQVMMADDMVFLI
ncbi:DNA replication licensing factor Mcm3 [Maniola hyperantus]|uniref:DNA replication licensing factor Mcm3 n=1 Tax=Aphantopus hyperantus TaxID=2795564 RepID=UPI00156957B7|nr:DNA replication licensing factor Mcm3 [Maniola hyperantus]